MILPRKNAGETVRRSLKGLGCYRGHVTGSVNAQFEQALGCHLASGAFKESGRYQITRP